MKTKIIALVGMCGSGKSIAADFLKRKGYEGVYFGKLTLEQLEKRGLAVNPKNEKKVREELRQKHGMEAYAVLSLPKITALLKKNKHVYIDGLYSWDEYLILKENFLDNLFLIEIYVDKHTRYRRLAERSFRPLNQEEALNRDIAEIERLAKGGPIAFSDFKCPNNSTVHELEKNMTRILHSIHNEF